jgi:membrane-associated phospholipid phosphatase
MVILVLLSYASIYTSSTKATQSNNKKSFKIYPNPTSTVLNINTSETIIAGTEYRIIEETGYSFPSGHSMISMAFYGYIIYLIYKYVKNKYIKWISIVLLSILICSIGISRIYLGVHYTSDVLGGFLISVSYLVIYISSIKKLLPEE